MKEIDNLIDYGIFKGLIDKRDRIYIINQLYNFLNIEEAPILKPYKNPTLHIDDILDEIVLKYCSTQTGYKKELLKSKIINFLIDKPSIIEGKFYEKYKDNKLEATNYYYNFAKDTNYIKEKQIKKNINYNYNSKYGDLNITINLSKPEKSLEEIELLKTAKTSSSWIKCALCKESEGDYGSISKPDRSNHRMIGLTLNNEDWFLQYSPYSYYNEHCIVLSKEHKDMKINQNTFENLFSFVEQFPHYFIGSNADLPIVGGSMLTHDHYQGGKYEFPIFFAGSLYETEVYNTKIQILDWPLSTIKLTGKNKEPLIKEAVSILNKWKDYTNEELNIINKTDKRHNTITPILKKKDDNFELYLLLRNNRQTKECPDGIFHPQKDKHNIKRENIGLIEAIGLAVLPGRLKEEMEMLVKIIENKEALPSLLSKHKSIYIKYKDSEGERLKNQIYNEIGYIFEQVLEDCSVFKNEIDKFKEFVNIK